MAIHQSEPAQDNNEETRQEQDVFKFKFVKIKVQRQSYEGKASMVILMRDVTEKIHSKIQKLKIKEDINDLKQAESFTSTVSDEMKTPLGSINFFVKQLYAIFLSEAFQRVMPEKEMIDAKRYFKCTFM